MVERVSIDTVDQNILPGISHAEITKGPVLPSIAAIFLISLIAPFLTYAISLACFGLAHIVFEMRYIQIRFQRGIPKMILIVFGLLLLGIAFLRASLFLGFVSPNPSITFELVLGTMLAACAATMICLAIHSFGSSHARLWRRICGAAVAIVLSMGIVAGIFYAPTLTLLIFSITHNFTPLAFIAEAAMPKNRQRSIIFASLIFIGIPILISSGAIDSLFSLPFFDLPIPNGSFERLLSAYIPSAFLHDEWAIRLFSGFVFAQCMHYGSTIYLYPKYSRQKLPDDHFWPSKIMLFMVVMICLVSALPFLNDFSKARSFYGIFAAVHAWIEIPLLLLLLSGLNRQDQQA